MDSETVESASHPAPTSAAATASQPDADRPVALEQAGPDAWGLVARMTKAGEWPEPELLEQILAAGDAATATAHRRPSIEAARLARGRPSPPGDRPVENAPSAGRDPRADRDPQVLQE